MLLQFTYWEDGGSCRCGLHHLDAENPWNVQGMVKSGQCKRMGCTLSETLQHKQGAPK